MRSRTRIGAQGRVETRGPVRPARISVVCLVVLFLASAGCSFVEERLALNAGNKLYKAQKYEEAIKEYEKVLASDPNNWLANYNMAISYMSLYHPGSTHPKDLEYGDKAVKTFERLLGLEIPDDATREKIRGNYVSLLQQTGRMDEAAQFFEGLLKDDPANTDLMVQVAQIYAKKGDFSKALEYFEKRAQVDPTNKEAWYTLGVACWERSYRGGIMVSNEERAELVDRGMAALDKALAIDSEYTSALFYVNLLWRERAKVLLDAGDVQGAGNAILKADEVQRKGLDILNRNKAAGQKPEAPPQPGA